MDAVLIDYQRNVPAAREPEVLSTMAIIVNKLGGHITAEIPQIFDAVFECTLNMINKVCGLHFSMGNSALCILVRLESINDSYGIN